MQRQVMNCGALMNKLPISEFRHAWRRLMRAPGYFLATLLMLSAGLGLATFMFGGFKAYFFIELPYPEPQQLAHIELQDPVSGRDSIEVPHGLFFRWEEQHRQGQLPIENIGAFYLATVNLSGEGRAERFEGAVLSADALTTLGVAPRMGRSFSAEDAKPGANPAVIISHTLWQHRFLGAPDIVGKTVRVNSEPATVVGVMPEGFHFPFNQDIWIPMQLARGSADLAADPSLEVFARLNDGAGPAALDEALSIGLDRLEPQLPAEMHALRPMVKHYADEYVSPTAKQMVAVLSACVLFVLFIACVNVAGLMTARGIRFQHETAIRGALGASRRQLMTGVLAESLLIAALAGVIGYLGADWGGAWIQNYLVEMDDAPPHWVDMSADWRDFAFIFFTSLGVALLAGLAPALRASRASIVNEMKEGVGGSGGRASRGLRLLVGLEITFSCVLLVSTGLMLRSVFNALDVDFGANTENVLTGRIGLFENDYPDTASRHAFLENLQRELEGIPGVEGAVLATGLPAAISGSSNIRPEGVENPDERFGGTWTRYLAVTPDYFDMFEIPLQQGRMFASDDDMSQPNVAVVTQAFVEEYLPDGNAIGRRVWVDADEGWVTIVGVTGNVIQDENDLDEPPQPVLYRPASQTDYRFFSMAVKTDGNPHAIQSQLRTVVSKVDPDMPVYWLRTLDDWIRIGTSSQHLMSTLLIVFTSFGVLLAGAGLYSVLAYAVNQRTREIGIRRALGADNRSVMMLFISDNLLLLSSALFVGLLGANLFARLLASEFVGVTANDPATYAGVLLVLAMLIGVSSWFPTRRALHVQPQEALRHE